MYYNVLIKYKSGSYRNLFHLNKVDTLRLIDCQGVERIHILEIYPHKGTQVCTVMFPSQRSDIGKLLKSKGFQHQYR